jgi:flagellar motility protein MotE (MotC chaperone)
MDTYSTDRMRLLPAVMVAAALMLTLKVTAVITGTSPLVTEVAAASEEDEAGEAEAEDGKDGKDETAEAEDDGTGRPAVNLATRPEKSERQSADVLQALAERRKALDVRENDVAIREKLLAAAEARIDEKITELKSLKGQIDTVFKAEETEGDAKYDSLVKVYENMKPKDAAAVFERLDMTVLLELLGRMNERKLAAIMAAMDPERAQAVTVELATANEDRMLAVPIPGGEAPLGLQELEPIMPGNAG